MKDRITLIFGKTGTGKTTLAKKLIKNESRLIAIDPLAEFNKFHVSKNFNDAFFYLKNHKKFKVSIRFDNDKDFDYLFKLVFLLENITILLEEAEIYISPSVKSSSFLRLVRYGRHKNISIIGVARRTAELSRDFRSQTNKIISFKQTEDIDIKNLENFGFKNLNKLNKHKFVEISL